MHKFPPARPVRSLRAALSATLVAFTLLACKPMKPETPFTAQTDIAFLGANDVLPRNINLKTFDPHRDASQFTCRHQAEHAPVLTPEAQALHEEAMQLTSPALWPNERNWPLAMALWDEAATQGHWKAELMWIHNARTGQGLNSEKGRFSVPPQDPDLVVHRVENLMHQGVADAFYVMGNLHDTGYGVKFSIDRAWAFWELAADLGSPSAQTQIALALPFRDRDQEKPNVAAWANRPLRYKLLECAHAQGYGKASYELGRRYNGDAEYGDSRQPRFATAREQYQYALQVLHDGVKFGSEDSAGYLFSYFDQGKPMVGNFVDKFRARRYITLADALFNNPDLRFPNLDKVIPLPPAQLPHWDGNPDSLVEAAKGVRVKPQLPKTVSSSYPRGHRAYVPDGHVLQVPEQLADLPSLRGYTSLLVRTAPVTGLACARVSGYWQARMMAPGIFESPWVVNLREEVSRHPPLYFREGERMQLTMENTDLPHEDMTHLLMTWHFVGRPVPVQAPQDWLVLAGVARAIDAAPGTVCASGVHCPVTGIWQPCLKGLGLPLSDGVRAAVLNDAWRWQTFVLQGQAMPGLPARGLSVPQSALTWRLMQAIEPGFKV